MTLEEITEKYEFVLQQQGVAFVLRDKMDNILAKGERKFCLSKLEEQIGDVELCYTVVLNAMYMWRDNASGN